MKTYPTSEQLNQIYNVLINLGGAEECMRSTFISYHSEGDFHEWRFQGKLGFGGKYYLCYNKVDCYAEDETPRIKKLIKLINDNLTNILND